jgi:hypothetical protein
MKILSEPSSGKIGNRVAFISRYAQCQRELVIPRNTPGCDSVFPAAHLSPQRGGHENGK